MHVVTDGRTEQLLLTTSLTKMYGIEKPGEKIMVDVHRFHLGDAQPLGGEVPDKTYGTVVSKKSARLGLNDCGVIQLA